jgi:hypothetical protein
VRIALDEQGYEFCISMVLIQVHRLSVG